MLSFCVQGHLTAGVDKQNSQSTELSRTIKCITVVKKTEKNLSDARVARARFEITQNSKRHRKYLLNARFSRARLFQLLLRGQFRYCGSKSLPRFRLVMSFLPDFLRASVTDFENPRHFRDYVSLNALSLRSALTCNFRGARVLLLTSYQQQVITMVA